MKTIIVTGANGDIGISIARILKEYNTEYKIIGTEIGDLWPAKNYFNKIHKIPKAQNDNYFFALKKILSSYENPLIIPTSEPELSVISNDYNRFKKLPLLINKSNIIKTFQDKYLTYKWLTKNNIPVATTYEIKNLKKSNYPIIIKPRKGSGSKNVFVIKNNKELLFFTKYYKDDFIAQEYLKNHKEEYTCAIFKDKKNNNSVIMKRKMKGDVTGEMFIDKNQKIKNILKLISNNINGSLFLNIQLRMENNIPKIFEINPRFSSTVRMRHMLGYQDLIWSINNFYNIKNKITKKINYNIKIYKTYDEIIENAS